MNLKHYTRAEEVLRRGETGLLLFTDGTDFEVEDGRGWTGNWRLSKDRQFDRVVLYKRERADPSVNLVYSALPAGTESVAAEPGRRRLRLTDVRCVGYGRESWKVFASTGRGALRYLTR